MKVSINETQFKSKPDKRDAMKISMNLKTIDTDIDDIFNRLINGQSICPIVLKDNQRKNANFISQQLFALDFDEGHSPEEIIQILSDHGIQTNFMYFSFSHKPEHPKFRIVIILDEVIENIKTRNLIQLGLMNISKYSDPACKDAARLFYGGKSGKIINSEPNKYADIIGTIDTFANVNLSRPTKSKNSKHLQNFTKKGSLKESIKGARFCKGIENYDFENACNISPVLMSFSKGNELKYSVLLSLASNMLYVKGGFKWMRNIMDKSANYERAWYESILQNVKQYNYSPFNIDSFDPSLIGEYANLLKLSKQMQGDIEVVTPVIKTTADYQQQRFKQIMTRIKYRSVIEGEDVKRINIIRASTGIGKTEVLLNQENSLIAVPTHALKDELVERFKAKGIDVVATPEVPKFKNGFLNQKLEYYYNNNLGNKARQLIKSASLPDGLTAGPEDMRIAQLYLDAMDKAFNFEGTVITTHKRAVLSSARFKHKKDIIFDEDCYKELLNEVNVKLSTVRKLTTTVIDKFYKGNARNNKRLGADLKRVLIYLEELPSGYAVKPPPLALDSSEETYEYLSSQPNGVSIIDLVKADHILKHIDNDDAVVFRAISKIELPKDKQVTICSATADEYIYSKLIDEDYDFIDFGVAKNKTEIEQFTGKQWSKSQMLKQIEIIQTDATVITYKAFKKLFTNPDPIVHFGNTTGYDHLKGKDIVIQGTPLPNPIQLHMTAIALGVKLSNNPEDNYREWKQMAMNGFRWYQISYRNDELAELEIRMTLQELEQAIGRSRSVRTFGKVIIRSSVPSQMADIYKIK